MRAGLVLLALGIAGSNLQAAPSGVRAVYLNGVDISSAKSQELKNVDISINERGDIFIVAPHYQVHEEDSFVPLSKFVRSMQTPQHKGPQSMTTLPASDDKLQPASALPNASLDEGDSPSEPAPIANGQPAVQNAGAGLIPKSGTKLDNPNAAAIPTTRRSGEAPLTAPVVQGPAQ